jgi:hypothetical protein
MHHVWVPYMKAAAATRRDQKKHTRITRLRDQEDEPTISSGTKRLEAREEVLQLELAPALDRPARAMRPPANTGWHSWKASEPRTG